uniref:Uncharacterized protein n=1 Tax=Zea mays TaxID=4577 RepID=C0HFJ9_MAIZE|nr:unknown [Zea mays]
MHIESHASSRVLPHLICQNHLMIQSEEERAIRSLDGKMNLGISVNYLEQSQTGSCRKH